MQTLTTGHARQHDAGFTLIELMIALVVVAILAAIAYPSYQNHLLRTRRATATACLQELAQQMERRYTTSMRYDQPSSLPAAACANDLSGFYSFAFQGSPTASTYTLKATPVGPQAKDTKCATLTLDHLGTKGITGSGSIAECWR